MPADRNGRIRYLVLAAFAQQVIDALMRYVETRDAGELAPALSKAISVLDALSKGVFYELRNVVAIGGYEQLEVMRGAWGSAASEAVLIQKVMDASLSEADRVGAAKSLIESFLKLERRALWSARQPSGPIQFGGTVQWAATQAR